MRLTQQLLMRLAMSPMTPKVLIETALNEEMLEHLVYDNNDLVSRGSGNIRNETLEINLLKDSVESIGMDVPRDQAGTFEPVILKNRQRH